MLQRVFYVTQGSLHIWPPASDAAGDLVEFTDDDAGLRKFDEYLGTCPDDTSAILIDVIEEDFALDSIPKLGMRDRNALIARRCQRKFRRTPYRLSILQGRSAHNADEVSVVYSAILNHELIDPWLQVILAHQTPLSGVYSVAMIAPGVVRKLFPPSASQMFVASHQALKLRQVFIQDGNIRSARLAHGPAPENDDYAQFVITELMRSRRYLERTRLLGGMETLDVCVVADADTAAKIRALSAADSVNQFQFIDPQTAAIKMGMRRPIPNNHFEVAFLSSVRKSRPKQTYSLAGEDRYWVMQRLRKVFIGAAVAVAAACTIGAAVLFSDIWNLQNRIAEIQSQVEFLTETFRRENEKFDPIKADSHEMQLAVDTGDFILANRVPVPWVMNQLGAVLGDYPDIQLRELQWSAESLVDENIQPRHRSDAPVIVTVPATNAVSALITADIVPFDGDMRRAFSRIDELAADLEARTNFDQAHAVEYPIDARTSAVLTGEIVATKSSDLARFKLRVYFTLAAAPRRQAIPTSVSNDNESI